MKSFISLLAICLIASVAHAADEKLRMNACMCHIKVDGIDNMMMMDAFRNDMKIDMCNDEMMEKCKKFCIDTEKEKTDGDLTKVSKISNKPYGDILCEKMAMDMDMKTLKMDAQITCPDKTMNMDTNIVYKNKLTCKDKKFVMKS